MTAPRVGVVAIGRNEGERLLRCLKSISGPDRVIVYVDSGSTDGSVANARAHGAIVHELDMRQPFSAGRARTEGFAVLVQAMPDLDRVQFLDGDCELESGWLDAANAFLDAHPDMAVACGRRRERFPEDSIYNRLCDIEWDTPIGEASACGGDALMRRDAFEQVGGYDPQLIAGEEPELCARMRIAGWRIWRLDQPMTLHDAAMTRFGQWWVRMRRSGFAYAQTYWISRGRPIRPFGRAIYRTLLWGGIVPVTAIVLSLWYPVVLLVVVAIYALRFLRIRARQISKTGRDGGYALFIILSPFAEIQGIVKYFSHLVLRKRSDPILYK